MNFKETNLKGAFIITTNHFNDHRGYFSRSFCSREFERMGLEFSMVQSNISYSNKKNTLRGMHFQNNGFEEAKLIRCVKGKILDTIIDLREESKTYGETFSIELDSNSRQILYVPKFFAHGFITLEDHTEVFYQVSEFYNPQNEAGIRWNDPSFKFEWPTENPIISDRDKNHPNFIL